MDITQEEISAQAQVWKHMYGFAETIMIRCALDLGIADILHAHGPMTLTQLANALPQDSINMDRFHHVMRYLVHMKLFKITKDEHTMEDKYTLTPASKLLVKDNKKCLAPYVMLQTHPEEFSIWAHLMEYLNGKKPYWESTYGVSLYGQIETDQSKYNNMVNNAMNSHTMFVIPAVVGGLMKSKILDDVNSLVDVGGSTGAAAKGITDGFPHVKCFVMDLAHVIESVPKDGGLNFVAGDMFSFIPKADAIFLKSVLHNYDDDVCLKILAKCKEAIPSTKGKVILVEIVVDVETLPEFSSARCCMDMEMMLMGGKERTKQEWADLLDKAGFSRHEIIPVMAIESIIVAYRISLRVNYMHI